MLLVLSLPEADCRPFQVGEGVALDLSAAVVGKIRGVELEQMRGVLTREHGVLIEQGIELLDSHAHFLGRTVMLRKVHKQVLESGSDVPIVDRDCLMLVILRDEGMAIVIGLVLEKEHPLGELRR